MMTTPSDFENFAVGFSLTEGVIQEPEGIRRIRVEPEESDLRLAIELKPNRLRERLARKRALPGRIGCRVCGIDDLKALPQARAPERRAPVIALSAIRSALLRLGYEQALNEITHAVHAQPGPISTERSGVSVRVLAGTKRTLDRFLARAISGCSEAQSLFRV